MILQSLVEYYDRATDVAPEGWEWKRIPFFVEIAQDGRFLQLSDMRSGPKASDVKPLLVPKSEIRSGTKSYEKPNTLWDHYGFVLGVAKTDKTADQETAKKQLAHFHNRIRSLRLTSPEDRRLLAIDAFYEKAEYQQALADPLWKDCSKIPGCNLTFRVSGDVDPVLSDQNTRDSISSTHAERSPEGTREGMCLVTGERSKIQQLHFPVAGVCEKPAPLSSINDGACPAFASFGKAQGFNFPVGTEAAFKYSTALSHLLGQNSRQRFRIGDSIAVFWAQKEVPEAEDGFAAVFGEQDDPDARTAQVRSLLNAINSGQFDGGRGKTLFYILGLAPNVARISVRFWHAAPLHEIARQIRQWFADLKVVRSAKDPEYPSLFRLLAACAQQGKADNIPPNLGGDIMRAILSGSPFPATWLNAAVLRCRAEQNVTYLRAATIKASLNRLQRFQPNQSLDKELSDMLDLENTSSAYRLGRLFAALEKIQEEASPGLNATIRERYYGAASSTPVAVFTTLLRLKNHHLAKLTNRGRAVNFERLLGEIMGGLNDFPKHLSLPEQGRFALGYYHQRQDFFSKSESSQSMQSTQGESK